MAHALIPFDDAIGDEIGYASVFEIGDCHRCNVCRVEALHYTRFEASITVQQHDGTARARNDEIDRAIVVDVVRDE